MFWTSIIQSKHCLWVLTVSKMKIICAGLPKTGTKSMANALTQLGYKVHDFEEHLEYNLENYIKFFDGDIGEEIFLDMYREVDVVVDQPASNLWQILHHPSAIYMICAAPMNDRFHPAKSPL